MQKSRMGLAIVCLMTLLLSAAVVHAAPQNAKLAGTWALSMVAPPGGGGGQGGGGGEQTLMITKTGDKYSITHHTGRGDTSADATVSGNMISWTEERTGRDGNPMKFQYQATVTGDDMKGTIAGGPAAREFTAKRSN